jgi:hypothetical protein
MDWMRASLIDWAGHTFWAALRVPLDMILLHLHFLGSSSSVSEGGFCAAFERFQHGVFDIVSI